VPLETYQAMKKERKSKSIFSLTALKTSIYLELVFFFFGLEVLCSYSPLLEVYFGIGTDLQF